MFEASGKLLGTIVVPPQTAPSAASNQTTQNVVMAGSRLVILHHQVRALLLWGCSRCMTMLTGVQSRRMC